MDDTELEAHLEAQLRLGVEALKAGEIPRAIELLSPVALQARAADLPGFEASACGMLAQAYPLTGQKDDALPYARRALEIAELLEDEGAANHFRQVVAALSTEDGAADDFDARVRAALKQAQDGDPLGAVRALIQLAEWAKGAAALGPEASARILLGQILLANDQKDLAVAELNQAVAIAEKLGDQDTAARIRDLLAGGEGA
jgi:tetratricopeptide (TPR) repeat protein